MEKSMAVLYVYGKFPIKSHGSINQSEEWQEAYYLGNQQMQEQCRKFDLKCWNYGCNGDEELYHYHRRLFTQLSLTVIKVEYKSKRCKI
ncbi:hypothetical protein scyTo_0008662 [Scyliorhinus torazame]|uniref:Uncharacterized protein n=1 Tax=Scyliorhinus torazame TaxID=75743 RepID=A0A401PC94_SCYTO|nr:hypothetical protein [Scyliorhinus torazame]